MSNTIGILSYFASTKINFKSNDARNMNMFW